MPGKFELYRDVGGRFRFRLLGDDGGRVLISEGYAKKVLALEAIVSVLKMAPEATLIDLTVAGNGEIQLTEQEPTSEIQVTPGISKAPARKKTATKKRVAKRPLLPAAKSRPADEKESGRAKDKKRKKEGKKKKSKKHKGKHKKKR